MFNPNKKRENHLKKRITSVTGFLLFFSCSNGFSAPINLSPTAINTSPIPAVKKLNSTITLPKKQFSPMLITNISPGNCVKKGSIITLSGSSFGSRTKKSLAMVNDSIHIDLPIIQWTDKVIKATVPNDSRLAEGKSYQIGIEAITHTAWLSPRKYIQLCSKIRASISSLSMTVPSQEPTPQNNQFQTTEQYDDGGNYEEGDYDYSADYEFYEPTPGRLDYTNRMGSLIGSGQPPPVEAMQLRTTGNKQAAYEPDELIIVTVDMDDAIAIQQEFSAYGIRVKRRQNLGNIGLVISTLSLANGSQADQVLAEVRAQYPNLWVSLNTRYQLQSADNHKRVMAMVGWDKASSQCGKNLRIGMIDTVIDTANPTFNGQSILQKSLVSRGVKPADADHGSAIAGLLIGNHQMPANTGLLPGAELFAANVFRKRGDSTDTTAEILIRALDWLVSQKVDAINMSLGGPENALLALAIENTLSKGIPVISSAGNNGESGTAPFPAAQPGVIGVTAIDVRNNLFSKATTGKHVTFAAPGVDIWVALAKQKNGYRSGTSYATPFITAALLLAKQQQPDKNPLKVLQSNAIDLGKKGHDERFGWGLVKFNNACAQ